MKLERLVTPAIRGSVLSLSVLSMGGALLMLGCSGGSGGATRDSDSSGDEIMFEDEAARAAEPEASEQVTEGERLLATGDAPGGEAAFRAAIEANDQDIRAYLDLGLALEMQERFDEAAEAYRAALAIDAGFAEALNNLGVIERDAGQTEQAIATLERAIAARPGFASAHLNLGLAREDAGDAEAAMQSYRRVIELAPGEPTSRIQLGLLQLGLGDTDQALITLRRAAAPAAGDRPLLYALGSGLRRAGDPQMAVRVLRESVAAGEDAPAPPALRAELALALFAADHRPEAEQELTALLEAHADYAIAHYLLANMMAAREAFADAARHYQAYLRLEPSGPQAAPARRRLEHVRSR